MNPAPDPSSGPAAQAPPRAGAAPHGDALLLSAEQAQAVVRLVEAAPSVRRRYQFFIWTQSQLQALLPHPLLVCGAYQRQRRELVLDVFHNIVLPASLLQALTDLRHPLVAALISHWVAGRGQPRALALDRLDEAAAPAAQALRDALGCSHLLVHGVSRPQRPDEIESLFIVGGHGGPDSGASHALAQRSTCLDLLLPHLHSTWQRVAATELELQRPAAQPTPPRSAAAADSAVPAARRGAVTERERQILRWVREGKSNQQIAEVLGISPLTVKNHIQKILRKLGAGNRAQAVAQALAQNLIAAAEPTE